MAAQPLAVGNLPTIGTCTSPCSLVFVATETDMLYAFNAASDSQTPIWSANLAAAGGASYVDCQGLVVGFAPCQPVPDGGKVGVTSTPVIDTTGNLLYVVGAVENQDGTVDYDLFAISILTGQVKGFVTIGGSATGKAPTTLCTSSYPNTGTITFDSNHRQTAALLLLNGNMIYVAFAPGDQPLEALNGWLFGYKFVPSTPTGIFTQVAIFNPTPFGTGGGIWQSVAGPAAEVRQDGTTFIYASTGNGTFDITGIVPVANDIGDSALKFSVNNSSGAIGVVDYYTPANVNSYNSNDGLCKKDKDFGSGGILAFPEAFYHDLNHDTYPRMSINGDKQSRLYVLNRDSMGHFNPAGGNLIELNDVRNTGVASQGFWSTPAYWKYVDSNPHYLLYSSVTSNLSSDAAYPMDMYEMVTSGSSGPIPATQTHDTGAVRFCKYSPTPVVSSHGTDAGSGLVWAIERQNSLNPTRCDGDLKPAALHAFNATTMAELYTSRGLTSTDLGTALSFLSPTVFNGRVFAGSLTKVNVFGLCASYTHGCKQ